MGCVYLDKAIFCGLGRVMQLKMSKSAGAYICTDLGLPAAAALNLGELRDVAPDSKRVGQTAHSVKRVGCSFNVAQRLEGEFEEVFKLPLAF